MLCSQCMRCCSFTVYRTELWQQESGLLGGLGRKVSKASQCSLQSQGASELACGQGISPVALTLQDPASLTLRLCTSTPITVAPETPNQAQWECECLSAQTHSQKPQLFCCSTKPERVPFIRAGVSERRAIVIITKHLKL